MKRFLMKGILVLVMVVGVILPTVSYVSAGRCVPGELSEVERESLIYMREEEKLARDVYTYLYSLYPLRIFSNIASSEQKHMDAIKVLLDRYNVPDPAEGKGPGIFENQDLQDLYNEFVTVENPTLVDALQMGVQIEETDINDLQTDLEIVVNKDIKRVYTNLLRASGKHLKAFTTVLSKYLTKVAQ
jgi:hypothetical protein